MKKVKTRVNGAQLSSRCGMPATIMFFLLPVDRLIRLATSWVGQLTALAAAAILLITKFNDLDKALMGSLNLSGTPVSDVSALKDLKSLTSLDLRLTHADGSALKDLKSLIILK